MSDIMFVYAKGIDCVEWGPVRELNELKKILGWKLWVYLLLKRKTKITPVTL